MLLPAFLAALGAAELPENYDAFLESRRSVALDEARGPAARAVLARSHVTQVEPRFGVPTVLWAERFPGARTPRDTGLSAAEAARQHLARHAAVYRLPLPVVAELQVDRTHDLGRGAVVVSFARTVAGLPVLRERLHVLMTQGYEAVAFTGFVAPLPDAAPAFALTAETALATAAQDLGHAFPEARAVRALAVEAGGWQRHAPGPVFAAPPRARRAFYATAERLVPAWHLEVAVPRAREVARFAFVVSALDGALLARVALSASAAHGYRTWAQPTAPFSPLEGPSGDVGAPHPSGTPSGYTPAFVPPTLVTLDHAGLSTGDSWLPAGATHLEGNNVRAYADLFPPDGLNQPDAGLPRQPDGGLPDGGFDDAGRPWRDVPDLRVPVSGPGAFDYTYDLAQAPEASATQRYASATHAFFVTNWLHDVFYDFGFTEAARNGQQSNLGRGGLGGDALNVEVHDFSGVDNANMYTPADGEAPRMQLYRFRARRPSRVVVSAPAALAGTFPGAPVGPADAVWSVTADLALPVSPDGGFSGCDDWLNRAALAGRVVAVRPDPTCAFRAGLDRALDAGAAGVVYASDGLVPVGDVTLPAHLQPPARVDDFLAALDAGQAVTVTLDRPAGVDRDVALDTGIVVHEWAHYLTHRLVAGGDTLGLANTAARGLDEGWSDFVALWALLRAADAQAPGNAGWQAAYTMGGGFATGGVDFAGDPNQSWYFGFRRYPLSTDLTKDPLTYKHVGTNVPLPDAMVVPRAVGLPADNAQQHNAGELWATALWEAQAALLNSPRYTFDAARAQMAEYLVASLTATPALPTFLEARDAVLAVVAASSPADDFPLFVSAFAKRGLGVLAQAPDRRSITNTPLAEDFTAAGGLYKLVELSVDDTAEDCDDDGVLDSNETGTLTLKLMNVGTRRLTNSRASLVTATPGFALPPNALPLPASDPFTVVTVTAPVSLGGAATGALAAGVDVRVTDATLATQPLLFSRVLVLNTNTVPSAKEGFEAGAPGWDADWDSALPWAHTFLIREATPLSHQMRGRAGDARGTSWLTTPPLQVGAGPLSFTFTHTFLFEEDGVDYYDGGILEVSTDGVDFTQIPGSAISPTYGGPLSTASDNPLGGRPAFRGTLATPTTVTVNLGTQYANRTVWVRWRIGTDSGGSREGWTLDDVTFTGLVGAPFTDVVAHSGRCINKPPTLTGTPNVTADERSRVTLVPGTATDPDGDAVTFTWLQTSGAPVALENGDTFTAPEVTDVALLGFRVTADDGNGGTDTDDITVTVRNVNRGPSADAGAKQTVAAGATVTLSGSGVDPDGDSLRFRWTQVNGVPVTLDGAETATATFTAPPAEVALDLTFSLTVRDGSLDSAPALVEVTVEPLPKGCGCASVEPLSLLALLALAARGRRRRARRW